jgi:hypothetical protein
MGRRFSQIFTDFFDSLAILPEKTNRLLYKRKDIIEATSKFYYQASGASIGPAFFVLGYTVKSRAAAVTQLTALLK